MPNLSRQFEANLLSLHKDSVQDGESILCMTAPEAEICLSDELVPRSLLTFEERLASVVQIEPWI